MKVSLSFILKFTPVPRFNPVSAWMPPLKRIWSPLCRYFVVEKLFTEFELPAVTTNPYNKKLFS